MRARTALDGLLALGASASASAPCRRSRASTRRQRRRGRSARRRQRRRQVDAGEVDLRDLLARRGQVLFEGRPVKITTPEPMPSSSGSRPSTRTWRCATTSTWSANLFLGQEVRRLGRQAQVTRQLDETRWSTVARAARAARGHDPERALGGGRPVRRPAPAGRGRAIAAGRAEGRAARRAHGGARRRADRARCSS